MLYLDTEGKTDNEADAETESRSLRRGVFLAVSFALLPVVVAGAFFMVPMIGAIDIGTRTLFTVVAKN